MAPLPIFQESQIPVLTAAEVGYNFPPSPGMSMPRSPPVPVRGHTGSAGAPDVDDVFVVVVSLAVVAALLAFVLLQAIAALREVLEQRSAFSTLPLSTFRKHGLLASLNSTEAEHQRLLEETASLDSNGYRYSRWVGVHRCQFTLSPDRYDSDTSSTLTRSNSSASTDSTVVGGRICVVYDDTVEQQQRQRHSDNSDEEDEEDDDDEEEDDDEESEGEEDDECKYGKGQDGDDSQCVPKRPALVLEPRPRVRRAAIFIQ